MPLSSVVGAQSIVKPGVCTSSTRPASPYDGQVIYMTDVDQTAVWDGSTWVVLAPIAGGRNVIINGAMNVWQRSTDATTNGNDTYASLDRWRNRTASGPGSIRVSRQLTGLTGFQYCARIQRTSGNTDTGGLQIIQTLETINSIPLAGKTVTISFYARKSATFSSASSSISAQVASGTGTDQYWASFTGYSAVVSQSPVLTTTWQRFTYTGTVSSSATQLYVLFQMIGVGTAGANDYFEITGIQLEEGAVATPFEFEDFGVTLAKCERYYYEQNYTNLYYNIFNSGNFQCSFAKFPVTMRATPTITVFDGAGNAGKISIANAGGTAQNNITPPVSIDVNTDGWQYVAGGIAGTTGNNGMMSLSKYTASIEL
jgi:hypothetical protein